MSTRHKYRNKKVKIFVDGQVLVFDSMKEHKRFLQLKSLQDSGKIGDIVVHPKFVLQDSYIYDKKKIGKLTFELDFKYKNLEDGVTYWEDVKSSFTRKLPVYRLKRKLFLKKLGNNNVFLEVCND